MPIFGRISPTYIWSWDQLWEVCPPKKDHSHIKVSTSKGLMKFDLSLLHEAIKKTTRSWPGMFTFFSFSLISRAKSKAAPRRGLNAKTKKHFLQRGHGSFREGTTGMEVRSSKIPQNSLEKILLLGWNFENYWD